ncbi:TM2 domain-containing protein [Paenibacillus chartarius]|uniref:TM2 domain-containing protein n=1 Tax=Paenibacillus chartarius TaxID=747481 RepID=A0ABV6DSA9_9BACL
MYTKNRITAAILALLLGGLGAHKFYLGKIGLGIVYLIFCWTWIPTIIGFIEGIIYLVNSDESFALKHDQGYAMSLRR